MKLQIFDYFPENYHQAWDELLANSPTNVPFLRFGYQKTWWQSMGGGEWDNGELYIIMGFENDRLVGIAPLFRTSQDGENILTFIGSQEISDYLDLIADPEYYDTFLNRIIDHLTNEATHLWAEIIFTNLPQTSPLLQSVSTISSSQNTNIHLERDLPAPYLELPSEWEIYLSGLDKKQRHEIRRKLRRVEQEVASYHFYFVENQQDFNAQCNSFLALMKEDQAKNAFLSDKMITQMQGLLSWSRAEEILRLCFLEINEVQAAAYFCFDDGNTIYLYNSGFKSDMQHFSPGWVLLSLLIQWAIKNSRTKLDFMRGSEAYKYKFGAVASYVYTATITKKAAV